MWIEDSVDMEYIHQVVKYKPKGSVTKIYKTRQAQFGQTAINCIAFIMQI